MFAFLQRLFRSRPQQPPPQLLQPTPRFIPERRPVEWTERPQVPPRGAAASTGALASPPQPQSPSQLSYDATEHWRVQLQTAREALAADPLAADSPDAGALLKSLSEGPDSVIRQLPAAARDALSLCDDASISRSQLASRLSRDPALVQGLLRAANSAAFGVGRDKVLSIATALDRIGLAGARAVVLSSCVDGLLSHPGGAFNAMASEVWAHMVRTGPLARIIAPAFAADPDEAFAIALLHDVGKLVIFDRLSVLRATRRRAVTVPDGYLHGLLQLLHEPLGAIAALQWGMGDRAAAAIGTHHRTVVGRGRDTLAETVFFAERTDHAERRGDPLDVGALWETGRLTGSPARVVSALQNLATAA